jgi:mannitol-1-phosphate/altronate dehydrogenase
VTSFAELVDPGLARWIDERVSFPSSMVDRITPETSDMVRRQIDHKFHLPDRWPVVTEPFRQWVIEDDFCTERPPLERVGVEFVSDVGPHKLVKARVLNGGHSALGYVGSLLGYTHTDSAMNDPVLRSFLERMLVREVAPLLPSVPGLDVAQYVQTTLDRFSNPAVGDALSRLCRRGSVKMPSYLLPSLHDALARGGPHDLLVLSVAAWMRYLRGTDLSGTRLDVDDPLADELQRLAREGGDDPGPLLSVKKIFGNLAANRTVVEELRSALRALTELGGTAFSSECPRQQVA